jgi:hypothetical protein
MNYFDYFRNWVEKRTAVEAYYYLDNKEKNKLKSNLFENKNFTKERMTLNLLDLKSSDSISFILITSISSFVYDRFYRMNKNYLKNSQNIIVRLLVLNSIYYLLFTDYQKFYEIAYSKYCNKI